MKKVLLVGLVCLLAANIAWAQEGEDELPPAPGDMVDVGGYSLHL